MALTATPPAAPADGARGGDLTASQPWLGAWVSAIRPSQWIKNAFVLFPLLFSGKAFDRVAELRELAAFAAFCLAASGVYLFNDVIDRATDVAHPVKRFRAIASGRISIATALATSALFIGAALVLGGAVSIGVGAIVLAYIIVNAIYAVTLKHIVILDVFAIASFFVMRLLAGAAAIDVKPSVWLLLCGGLLALYLGFAKRRAELELLGPSSADHRAVLSKYTTELLDQVSLVLLAVTIVSYIMYTLESDTAKQVGSEALTYSTVFVLFGVFRYLYLVHRRGGGNPSETLLTDRVLLFDVLLWIAYCAYTIYR